MSYPGYSSILILVYAAFRFRGTVYNVENELKVLSREPPKPLRLVELR